MVVRINLDYVQPGVTLAVHPKKFKLKELRYFTQEKNKTKLENRGIWGVILAVTKPTTVNGYGNQENRKKARTSYMQTKSYHRWFLCADVLNPPHTFALITPNHTSSYKFLKYIPDQSLIGLPFYLIEPRLSTNRLGDYLHIINVHDTRLIPLNRYGNPSHCPIQLPNDDHQSFYFLLENQAIKLATMTYRLDTCTGFQCDRQKDNDCVCVKPGLGSKMVYAFDIIFNVEEDLFGSPVKVSTIASYQTMSVFFQNLNHYLSVTTPDKEHIYLDRRRSQVRRMIKFVNETGGWKLTGWCKKGLLQIDGEPEKVVNNEVNLHLCCLYPQYPKYMNTSKFKALQITCDFDQTDSDLNNLNDDSSSDSSAESSVEDSHSSNRSNHDSDYPSVIHATNNAKDDLSNSSSVGNPPTKNAHDRARHQKKKKHSDSSSKTSNPPSLDGTAASKVSKSELSSKTSKTAKYSESGYPPELNDLFCEEMGMGNGHTGNSQSSQE